MSTVRYSFLVQRAAAGAPKRLQAGKVKPVPNRVPRIARLLALAHKFQEMLDCGEVGSMSDLARLGRVSRARITQIMDLLMLAPDVQEIILFDAVAVAAKDLKRLSREWAWPAQRSLLFSIRENDSHTEPPPDSFVNTALA